MPWTSAIVWSTGMSQPTGSGSGSPPPSPLRTPNVLGAGACQTPSIFCSEKPTGLAVPSATPMSVAAVPFAGPPVAVSGPS